jgi:hypothetical protein
MSKRFATGPSLNLRDFMRRGQVLSQYRSFQRELRLLPAKSASRVELAQKIREGFQQNKNEKDRAAVKAMLTEGTRQLQFLRTYAGTARRGSGVRDSSSSNMVSTSSGSSATLGETTSTVSAVLGTDEVGGASPNKSWVGTGDKDDIRGRVGVGWPWGSGGSGQQR